MKKNSHIAYLSIGSNLGDRKMQIDRALSMLSTFGSIANTSSLYETPPWGFTSDTNFYNKVLELHTRLAPIQLLHEIKTIESALGSTHDSSREGYASRAIDIDILLYNDHIYISKKLVIPHRLLHKRLFVLQPLLELMPTIKHPLIGLSIQSIMSQCKDPSTIMIVNGI